MLNDQENVETNDEKILNVEEHASLVAQNTRLVSSFKAEQLEKDAKKNWDLFYKRNDTRFFKDRHWTTREFCDLVSPSKSIRSLWEVGCGVGNFVFPLIAARLNFTYVVCDLSHKAIELVKSHELYNENIIRALQADVTDSKIVQEIGKKSIDIATLIFVLSAVHPSKFVDVLRNIRTCLKPGGILLFRDYGIYDMAQLRFKAGHKIADNFYMRQDGTRSYYFSLQLINEIMREAGFKIVENIYVYRRTVNKKENIDMSRIFVQGKFCKELDSIDY